VIAWALVCVAVAFAPLVYGRIVTLPGTRFSGLLGTFHEDWSSYRAWMRQAHDGHFLFRDLYTSEPHGRVFFHPLFWLMGVATRLPGLSVDVVWLLVHAVGCMLMVVAIHRFASFFSGDAMVRRLTLVLATTASGFGWITLWIGGAAFAGPAIDLVAPEANGFQAMTTWFFPLPIALALMLEALLAVLRHLEDGQTAHVVRGGFLALLLATIHPYDLLTLDAVALVWTLAAGRRRFAAMIPFFALPLPMVLYSFGAVRLDAVLSKVSWTIPSPSPAAYVLGWGLPLLLAVSALAWPSLWKAEPRRMKLLALWLAVETVLLALPLGFQLKLAWGMHVPICLLASMLVACFFRKAKRLRFAAACVVVAAAAIGSAHTFRLLVTLPAQPHLGDYVPAAWGDAFDWLAARPERDAVVVASPFIAPFVPGATGLTVFEGHWAQTLDRQRKQAFVHDLFEPPGAVDASDVRRVLIRNRVRYILLDSRSARDYGLGDGTRPFDFGRLARVAWQRPQVMIWEVTPEPATGEHQPPPPEPHRWTSGDWRGP
jgi:hypothetical protein